MDLRMNRQMKTDDAVQMNPLQLAYLGDSVWELFVRYRLIIRKYNVHHLHKHCVELVNAGSQARILKAILPLLTEEENEIVKRGRNAHPKHAAPRNQDPADYAYSTGFEALIGFLYLTGREDRILHLAESMKEEDLHA